MQVWSDTARASPSLELLIMVLSAAIMGAAAIPRLFSMADDAATSAGSSILGALETANSLTFSRQLARGVRGTVSMGDILSNVDIKGVESSEVTVSSCGSGSRQVLSAGLSAAIACPHAGSIITPGAPSDAFGGPASSISVAPSHRASHHRLKSVGSKRPWTRDVG